MALYAGICAIILGLLVFAFGRYSYDKDGRRISVKDATSVGCGVAFSALGIGYILMFTEGTGMTHFFS